MLASQMLYKFEKADLVKFGEKFIDQGIVKNLNSIRKELQSVGFATNAVSDEQLVDAFLKSTNPTAHQIEKALNEAKPQLPATISKIDFIRTKPIELGVKTLHCAYLMN